MHTIPCNWSEIMSSFETIVKVEIIVMICIYFSCYFELLKRRNLQVGLIIGLCIDPIKNYFAHILYLLKKWATALRSDPEREPFRIRLQTFCWPACVIKRIPTWRQNQQVSSSLVPTSFRIPIFSNKKGT